MKLNTDLLKKSILNNVMRILMWDYIPAKEAPLPLLSCNLMLSPPELQENS